MTPALFISYSHIDMIPINWLERLKLYLAPLRRNEILEIWDDTRIQAGQDWRLQINDALEKASAAILLVGAGFLASEFIHGRELPTLLDAARTRGMKIYPLIIGYCAYSRSALEPYQAFNEPDQPLESLSTPGQNKILNDLGMEVDEAMRHASAVVQPRVGEKVDLRQPIQTIQHHLHDTLTGFHAQARRRNDLVDGITTRLEFYNDLQYEKFFFRFYDQMTPEERFEFDQIRAITEGPLYGGNRAILEILNKHPELFDEIPALMPLRQHLVFWLNKYDKVFANTKKMCLLYAGVEDGVPFPPRLDAEIANWLARKQKRAVQTSRRQVRVRRGGKPKLPESLN